MHVLVTLWLRIQEWEKYPVVVVIVYIKHATR